MERGFCITKLYTDTILFEHEDLGPVVVHVVARALTTGHSYALQQFRRTSTGRPEFTHLANINPNSFDFRRITPESALIMKALAQSLVPDIDSLVLEEQAKTEGPT